MNDFFKHKTLVIDQEFTVIKNAYNVLDDQGAQIGQIKENMGFFKVLLRIFLSKSMLPFNLEVTDKDGNKLVNLKRGFTIFTSTINVLDADGQLVGTVKQKFKLLKPEFKLFDAQGNQFGTMKGDWAAWDFTIADMNGNKMGTVNKQWGGALKELFTDSDKYFVNIEDSVTDEKQRVVIMTVASLIDMILKEENN